MVAINGQFSRIHLEFIRFSSEVQHLTLPFRSALHHLSHAPNFVLTWATFFGAGLVLWIYRLRGRRSSRSPRDMLRCLVPFDPLTTKSFHIDLMIAVIRKLTDALLIVPESVAITAVAAGVAAILQASFAQSPGMMIPTALDAVMATGVLIVAIELGEYLNHYANHKLPILWELHKVHHAAEVLNPLTDKRAHPLSVTLKVLIVGPVAGLPAGVFMYLFGMNVAALVIASQAAIGVIRYCTLDPLKHSHLPLGFGPFDRLFISPHMHQVHHSSRTQHWDKNFGINLSIFDWLFGTAYKPRRGDILTFGVSRDGDDERQRFDTLWDNYVEPVKRMAVVARKARLFPTGSAGDADPEAMA
jgi:sterol desaturase/sphingolipid hydroxylase (fatty acid hydroxylase superfamily)